MDYRDKLEAGKPVSADELAKGRHKRYKAGLTPDSPHDPSIRDWGQDEGLKVDWHPDEREVQVGEQRFEHGDVPGTYFKDGHHYVSDPEKVRQALGLTDQEEPEEEPYTLEEDITTEAQSILQEIRDYIQQPHKTPDEVLQSEYGQQLMDATEAMRDQQMRESRAQLAGAGALYPDDTRAADRFAQVGAETARMQAAEILPAIMEQARSQRAMGLEELLTGLEAQTGVEQQAVKRMLDIFQTYAPYTHLTEEQRQRLPLDWAQVMGEVPGTLPGQQFPEGYTPPPDFTTEDVREIIGQMEYNSRLWPEASPEEKAELEKENQQLGNLLGLEFDPAGTWHWPDGSRVY